MMIVSKPPSLLPTERSLVVLTPARISLSVTTRTG